MGVVFDAHSKVLLVPASPEELEDFYDAFVRFVVAHQDLPLVEQNFPSRRSCLRIGATKTHILFEEIDVLLDVFLEEAQCLRRIAQRQLDVFDYAKTALSNNLVQFCKEVKQLDLSSYDLVLNDFEPVTAWAAKQQNKPSIGISHQNAFRNRAILS